MLVLGLPDVDQSLILHFQITEQARVLLWSATRCARDSSAGLSAPKHSAVPQWAEPGATPVRCVLPSLTPAAVASFPTSAPELVKVRQQEEQRTYPVPTGGLSSSYEKMLSPLPGVVVGGGGKWGCRPAAENAPYPAWGAGQLLRRPCPLPEGPVETSVA